MDLNAQRPVFGFQAFHLFGHVAYMLGMRAYNNMIIQILQIVQHFFQAAVYNVIRLPAGGNQNSLFVLGLVLCVPQSTIFFLGRPYTFSVASTSARCSLPVQNTVSK